MQEEEKEARERNGVRIRKQNSSRNLWEVSTFRPLLIGPGPHHVAAPCMQGQLGAVVFC